MGKLAFSHHPTPTTPLLVVALLTFVYIPITTTHALVFTLHSGRVRCITDTLRPNSISSGHYRIEEATTTTHHKISVKVSDPKGGSVHLAESVESGQFGFVAAEDGEYSACFWTPKFERFGSVSVEFEWNSGVAAKDWGSVAKKEKIAVLEMELTKLEDSVHSIHEEMIFLRERVQHMQKLNETTNSRMGLLSLLSLFLCLGVAGLQLWHLKTFFEKKKIL